MENNITNKEIYEVTLDDYKGFYLRLIKQFYKFVTVETDDYLYDRTYLNDELICERVIPSNENESIRYYIYTIPGIKYFLPPQPIRKVELTNKEDVQHLFEIINSALKEKYDRSIQ